MQHYATILSGDETLAADILASSDRDVFTVRCIDEETRRDAGIDAVVCVHVGVPDADTAIRLANAWVTQTQL